MTFHINSYIISGKMGQSVLLRLASFKKAQPRKHSIRCKMKEQNTQIPSEQQRDQQKRLRIFYTVLMYAASILAVACLIGILVSVLMLNFGSRSAHKDLVLYILSGSFAGGAAVMALCTFLFTKLINSASQKELDIRERLDSEESFFVGDGTLLTFSDTGLTLHGEVEGQNKPVFIPYHEARFISICTRRRPQEKGEWCVAIEIPLRYLTKNETEKPDEKVLVQADAKDRLYKALEKYHLTLFGEERKADAENKKFTPVQKFSLPNKSKRNKALMILAIGILLIGGGVLLGIFVNPAVGALAGAVGLVVLMRSILAFLKAKAVFGVYQEGIFWRESSGNERLFLKWEDIESVSFGEKNGYPVLTFFCDYGRYAIPAVEGAYECIKGLREEKCTKEK